jgi:pimeloyl-ACP methyl ester carboxylesterase
MRSDARITRTRHARTEDGASIAYQTFGEGDVDLVVAHAWFSHIEIYWEPPRFARFMRRLARGARVVHFDKRGTGLSDRLAHVPTLETRMDDIRAVMDAEGFERAVLLGWGDGAGLAALFAATYPHRTTALCFYGPARLA